MIRYKKLVSVRILDVLAGWELVSARDVRELADRPLQPLERVTLKL